MFLCCLFFQFVCYLITFDPFVAWDPVHFQWGMVVLLGYFVYLSEELVH